MPPKINVMEILSRSYYAKKIDSWLGSGLIIVPYVHLTLNSQELLVYGVAPQ